MIQLTARLQNNAAIAKYLTEQQGEAALKLKHAGTTTNPRPTLDATGVKKAREEKALDTISDVFSDKKSDSKSPAEKKTEIPAANEAQGLLKVFFGR